MVELFKLLGRIIVDNTEANKSLGETTEKAKDTGEQLGKTGNEGEKSGGKLTAAFSKVGQGAIAVGKTIAVGVAAGATAIGALTVKALNLSGELEQNMGGSEQVFKEYAEKMQTTAKSAFENMGLSTSDFLATANKMGALFQGAGFSIKESSEMSAEAMQRAADVASIMGIDTSAAMEAVAGAAKGNFTMMDNLGVAMNDTTLEAYALSKGIKTQIKDMTIQEKVGLAMEMFMEKTAYAAGNYARENETLAGSLGTAKAAMTNFLDGSGNAEQLVTAFTNAAKVIVKNVREIAPRLIVGLGEVVTQIAPVIPELIGELLPVVVSGTRVLLNSIVSIFPSLLGLLMELLPVLVSVADQLFSGIVAALPALLGALMDALPALIAVVGQLISGLVAALPSLLQMLVTSLPSLIPMLVSGLVSLIVMLSTMLPQIIQPIVDNLPQIVKLICNTIIENLPLLIRGLIDLMVALVEAIPVIVQALVDCIPDIVEMVIIALMECKEALILGAGRLIFALAAALPQIIVSLNEALIKAFIGIWNGVKGIFQRAPQWFADRFNATVEGVAKVFASVKDAITKPFEKARDTIKTIADKIKGFFSGEISMPKIKLPHFTVKPSGWKIGDLLKGSIPSLGVDWYAKAMDNPLVMSKPTIFGYNPETGKFKGGGEAGTEVVSGASTLMNMIRAAVASENEELVYYLQKLVEILANFFPQILERAVVLDTGATVGALAVPMNKALGKISAGKDRGR